MGVQTIFKDPNMQKHSFGDRAKTFFATVKDYLVKHNGLMAMFRNMYNSGTIDENLQVSNDVEQVQPQ